MFELTFNNTLVELDTGDWGRLLLDADIDFTGGVSEFWFAVHDPTVSETSYRVGHVKLDQEMLVTLMQQSAIAELDNMAQADVGLEPTGVYDCKTAEYMSIIAAYYREQLKTSDAWLLTPFDTFMLMTRSTYFQIMVNKALEDAGYEGASGANGIPLIRNTWAKFVPPKMPEGCDVAVVGGGEASGPSEGFEDVGLEAGEQKSSYPVAVVGAIVGVVGALGAMALFGGKGR
jgi:hypothetical protein